MNHDTRQANIKKERLIGLLEFLGVSGALSIGLGLWLISLPAFLIGVGGMLLIVFFIEIMADTLGHKLGDDGRSSYSSLEQ